MCLMPYANNKGADQPAHPRSLISAFVVRYLDNIISLDSIGKISRLQLASVAAQPDHEKMCLMPYANNKGADQPAHPRSLISAFVVRYLDNIISLDSIGKISRLQLASVSGIVGNSRRHVLSCRGSHIFARFFRFDVYL